MKRTSKILWGIVLIVVGVIFGLNALEITNINIFFDGWWCLFIIVPCFIDLFKDEDKTGDIIGLVIGGALFLACQDFISFKMIFKLAIPFIIVMFGVSLLLKGFIVSGNSKKIENKKDTGEIYATFSGEKLNYAKEKFDGVNLNAIFGGIELDLRDAIIKEDVVINTTAVFGGVDIMVPDDVNVKVVSSSIFGGTSNKSKNSEGKVTIYINTTCIFGGVEIK